MKKSYQRTIFVTGGSGFIGSNYLNKFVPLHPEWLFVNIDCLTYASDVANISVGDAENYMFEQVTINDKIALEKVFVEHEPTAVIHFAAESHVDMSITDPDIFIQTNVVGTQNLLVLAQKYSVQRFHQISTDEVYGALFTAEGSFSEDDPLDPRNPYSASKAAAELIVRAYGRTFGLPVVITRCSNAYGPNQDYTKLIPSFILKLQNAQAVSLYGKGEQIREWTYVEDCVDAIHLVFTQANDGETYNIGSGVEHTNYDLTCKLLALCNADESSIAYVTDRLGHDFRYSVDVSKIKKDLQWSPAYTFEEGLEKTIAFYTKK